MIPSTATTMISTSSRLIASKRSEGSSRTIRRTRTRRLPSTRCSLRALPAMSSSTPWISMHNTFCRACGSSFIIYDTWALLLHQYLACMDNSKQTMSMLRLVITQSF